MTFKLGITAEKSWRETKGIKKLVKLITGIKFRDGKEIKNEKTQDAA